MPFRKICLKLLPAAYFVFSLVTASAQIDTSIENIRLAIPQNTLDENWFSFEDELAVLVQDKLEELWIDDIYVGITYNAMEEKEIPAKYFLKFMDWLDKVYYSEVAAVNRGEVKQVLIKTPESEHGSEDVNTEITLSIDFFSVDSLNYLGGIQLQSSHFGGDSTKSRKEALKTLEDKLDYELKRIFWYNSDIIAFDNQNIQVNKESIRGAYPGTVYAIHNPPGKEDKNARGRRVGFAVLDDTANATLKVLRTSRSPVAGSWIIEHPDPIFALAIEMEAPLPDTYTRIGLNMHGRAMRAADWGGGIQFIRMTDSWFEYDFGFGFNTFGLYRFFDTQGIDLSFWGEFSLDLPFKKDDDGEWVTAALFSASLGIQAEFPFHSHFGFYIKTGYRLGLKTDHWTWSDDDTEFPAFWWGDEAPSMNNTGIVLAAGIKLYIF